VLIPDVRGHGEPRGLLGGRALRGAAGRGVGRALLLLLLLLLVEQEVLEGG